MHARTRARHRAPQATGLTFSDLSNAPSIEFLTALFNAILRTRIIPKFWKYSKLTMIYEKGDMMNPSSWRPISGQETTSKIFAGLLADRLQAFVREHSVLPEWQRATTGTDGCHECNLALDLARDHAKALKTELHLIWLDVHNAFGSVNRQLLFKILARSGVPPQLCAYSESSIRG